MADHGRPQVYDPKKDDGNIDVALGVVNQGGHGRVMMTFERPITQVIWDPENARVFGEQLARASYEARFGVKPQSMGSMLSEERRLQLTHRIKLVAKSEAERGKNDLQIATAVLDVILNEVA